MSQQRREIARVWWANACARERVSTGMRELNIRFPRIEAVAVNASAFLTPWLGESGHSYIEGIARGLMDRWQVALEEEDRVESKHVVQGQLFKVMIDGCMNALNYTITSATRGAPYWDPLVEPLLDYWHVHGRVALRVEPIRLSALPSDPLCRLAIATRVMTLRDLRLLQEAAAGDHSYDTLLLSFLNADEEVM